MAASAAPTTKVKAMTALVSTPIRLATRWFSAVARMARPILLRVTSSDRPIMIAAEAMMITTCTGVMNTPAIGSSGVVEMSCGKVW